MAEQDVIGYGLRLISRMTGLSIVEGEGTLRHYKDPDMQHGTYNYRRTTMVCLSPVIKADFQLAVWELNVSHAAQELSLEH